MTMKGLPSTYNKDLQEDKEPLFDSVENISASLRIAEGVIATMEVNEINLSICLFTYQHRDLDSCRKNEASLDNGYACHGLGRLSSPQRSKSAELCSVHLILSMFSPDTLPRNPSHLWSCGGTRRVTSSTIK